MARRILIILHQERSNPGRVAQELLRRGCVLDIRRPSLGDPLPGTMAEHDAAVIFGGPMSANDDLPFIKAETEWIGVPLKEGKPYFGICLGAQLMARHLGARVYGREDERVEVGYYPIRPTSMTERCARGSTVSSTTGCRPTGRRAGRRRRPSRTGADTRI
jgi:GMP synthase (glutamine-hydrolysing)